MVAQAGAEEARRQTTALRQECDALMAEKTTLKRRRAVLSARPKATAVEVGEIDDDLVLLDAKITQVRPAAVSAIVCDGRAWPSRERHRSRAPRTAWAHIRVTSS